MLSPQLRSTGWGWHVWLGLPGTGRRGGGVPPAPPPLACASATSGAADVRRAQHQHSMPVGAEYSCPADLMTRQQHGSGITCPCPCRWDGATRRGGPAWPSAVGRSEEIPRDASTAHCLARARPRRVHFVHVRLSTRAPSLHCGLVRDIWRDGCKICRLTVVASHVGDAPLRFGRACGAGV